MRGRRFRSGLRLLTVIRLDFRHFASSSKFISFSTESCAGISSYLSRGPPGASAGLESYRVPQRGAVLSLWWFPFWTLSGSVHFVAQFNILWTFCPKPHAGRVVVYKMELPALCEVGSYTSYRIAMMACHDDIEDASVPLRKRSAPRHFNPGLHLSTKPLPQCRDNRLHQGGRGR